MVAQQPIITRMATIEKTFLSAAELAERLGVSRRGVLNLIRDRTVPVVRLRGRDRVPSGALARWISEKENEALDAVREDTS